MDELRTARVVAAAVVRTLNTERSGDLRVTYDGAHDRVKVDNAAVMAEVPQRERRRAQARFYAELDRILKEQQVRPVGVGLDAWDN